MEKEEFLKRLGEQIQKIRKEKGISQTELANRCYKDKQAMERIENAKINTSVYQLYEISKALDIQISKLLEFDTTNQKK
ncbi:MAG: transcriptional regulator [Bacteroidetes bacterium]|nr:MAG: transcriptional regulator [Bacteroidota bacterium]